MSRLWGGERHRAGLEVLGFLRWSCQGVSPDDWRGLFYKLARHVPGLGGVDSFDSLELAEVLDLAKRLTRDLEREAKAWKR